MLPVKTVLSLWGVEGSGVLCWHWRRASGSVSWALLANYCWVFSGGRTCVVTNFTSHWLQRGTSIWGLLIVNLFSLRYFLWLSLVLLLLLWSFAHEAGLKWISLNTVNWSSLHHVKLSVRDLERLFNIKSPYYSYRGLKFGSQHLTYNFCYRQPSILFWLLWAPIRMQIHIPTHLHIYT